MTDIEKVEKHIRDIEEQLKVNLAYFSGSDKECLDILQGHVKDSLNGIKNVLNISERN